MIRRIQLTLLALFVGVWAMASETRVKNADGVEIWYNFDSNTKTASVTYKWSDPDSYDEYIGNVVIPSKVTYEGQEYSVTSIGDYAFFDCSSLTSITIPEGVTSIGKYAFYECNYLTSITIPEGVTEIGLATFCCCSSLTSITLPESVTSIGDHAFDDCYRLYEVYNKSNLTITAGSSENGFVAYYAKKVYTDESGESKLKTVGDYIFYVDEDIIELLAYIGDEIAITLPSDYEGKDYIIANYAFYNCRSLTSITIPKGVTKIGEGAFSYCSSLTSITLPESLTEIGYGAFYNCYKLYEVYNKSNLTITAGSSENGFVAYYAKKVYTDESGESKLKTVGDYIFYVDEDNIELLAYIGDEIAITLPSDYEGKDYIIANYAFYKCRSLTSITIPKNVTEIANGAFAGCYYLTSITIPEGVTSIGEEAFYYCSSLTSITLPESVTSIGEDAFYGCDSLTSITIPESVTSIGGVAFYGCYSLTSIDVALDNNSYTSIDGVLFSKDKTILIKYPNGKKDVTSYIIPEGVTEIGERAFEFCSSLTSITLPKGVTKIGSDAFDDCYRLYEVYNKSNLTITAGSSKNGYVARYAKKVYTDESEESKLKTVGDYIFYVDEDNIELLVYLGDETAITLPSDYEGKDYIIANRAFMDCYSLTSITLPKGVTKIGSDAFYDCESLTSITIPEGVTEIGSEAFAYCDALTSITSMNVTPPSIYDYTFDGVDKSIPVYVPKQSVEAYKSAEYWDYFTNIQGIDDTPISDVVADSVSIRLIGNSLIVEGAESYAVYALSGQYLGKVESLERGVYIVVADGVSKRIVVK